MDGNERLAWTRLWLGTLLDSQLVWRIQDDRQHEIVNHSP
jgi:hypothetical protein